MLAEPCWQTLLTSVMVISSRALDPDYLEEQKPGLSLRQQAPAVKPRISCVEEVACAAREFSQEEFLVQAALKARAMTSCVVVMTCVRFRV